MYTHDNSLQAKINRESLKLLGARLLRHKKNLAFGFLALLAVDSMQLIFPKIIQYTIDSIAGGAAAPSRLWLFAGAVIVISVAIGICRFFWRYFLIGASYMIERDIRQDLYNHLQKLPPQFYDKTKVGDPKAQFGLSWQVVPKGMAEMLKDPASAGAQRAFTAMLGMKKIDIAALKRASEG